MDYCISHPANQNANSNGFSIENYLFYSYSVLRYMNQSNCFI